MNAAIAFAYISTRSYKFGFCFSFWEYRDETKMPVSVMSLPPSKHVEIKSACSDEIP
jgi:hypothetical protein